MSRRIAIVAHHALGGSGVMAVEWSRLLADRGHDVHLFRTGSNVRDGILNAPPPRSGRAVVTHRVVAPSHPVLDGPSEVVAMGSALLEAHAALPFDVVHLHYALPFAVLLPLLTVAPRSPVCVVSLHGSDVTGIGADPSYAPALRLALAGSSAVTAPGPWLAEAARDGGFVGRDAVVTLPNFVALDRFHPRVDNGPRDRIVNSFGDDDGTPVVMHLSNFRPVKRATDAIDAVACLRARRRIRLLLVGDGPERPAIEVRARDALGADVAAVGAVDCPAPWLRDADALLMPSETESFGLAALEALATGTPVVASNAAGLADWLGDAAGAELCAVGDVKAFADALDRTLPDRHLADPDRGSALRAAARQTAERCGNPAEAARVAEALYDRLLLTRDA